MTWSFFDGDAMRYVLPVLCIGVRADFLGGGWINFARKIRGNLAIFRAENLPDCPKKIILPDPGGLQPPSPPAHTPLVLWMTSCCHIMEPMVPNQARRHVSSSLPGGSTGGVVCRHWLCLMCDMLLLIFAPIRMCAKYCNQRVCMSVCMSVRSHITEARVQSSRYFLYMLPVAVAHAIRYVFLVLYMTSCFHMGHRLLGEYMDACQIYFIYHVWLSSPDGRTGTKSDVCSCLM